MIRIRTHLNKITLVLFCILFSTDIWAQVPMGAEALGLGYATTALHSDSWAVFGNPSAMVSDRKTVTFYSYRSYGIIALTDVAAQITIPTKVGIVGAGMHRYGDDLFSETRIRAGYSNKWQGVHFGVILNYNVISFGGDYGTASAVGLDLGMLAPISDRFSVGAKATNVNQPAYGNSVEDLPREIAAGLSYKMEEQALFLFDVVKDVRFPVSYRAGVEFLIIGNLEGRLGVTTEPQTYSAGLGYRSDKWKVNIAFQRHNFLGISSGIDINFLF